MSNMYEGVFKAKKENKRNEKIGKAAFGVMLALLILFSSHPIVGDSMYPTYHDGQNVIAVKALGPIKRGQVVIAFAPDAKMLIKRAVGLPGDTVEIRNNGNIYVNGKQFEYGEGNALACVYGDTMQDNGMGGKVVTLGKGEYFLVGDNHENSLDSRAFGKFKRTDIWEVVLKVF